MRSITGNWYVIGISGAPVAFRKEIARYLFATFPRSTTKFVFQKRYFYDRDEEGRHPEKEFDIPNSDFEYNYETIASVDHDEMYAFIQRILKKKFNFFSSMPLLILEGFRLYDDERLRKIIDLPLFFDMADYRIRVLHTQFKRTELHYLTYYVLKYYRAYYRRVVDVYKDDMENIYIFDSQQNYFDLKNQVEELISGKVQLKFPST